MPVTAVLVVGRKLDLDLSWSIGLTVASERHDGAVALSRLDAQVS
jgi:hypothetical protein